jgi:hypothetical protein
MQFAVYQKMSDPMRDPIALRVAKIAALKEALRSVRDLPEEMRLLGTLSDEISALRELRELVPQGTISGRLP